MSNLVPILVVPNTKHKETRPMVIKTTQPSIPSGERLIIMQTEDGMVSLEREDRTTLIYPLQSFPKNIPNVEGTIIRAIVHSEDCIEFIAIDTIAMEESKRKRAQRKGKRQRLRERARRSTSQMQTELPDQTNFQ